MFILEKKSSQNNNVSFHFKKLGKRDQICPNQAEGRKYRRIQELRE